MTNLETWVFECADETSVERLIGEIVMAHDNIPAFTSALRAPVEGSTYIMVGRSKGERNDFAIGDPYFAALYKSNNLGFFEVSVYGKALSAKSMEALKNTWNPGG